MFKFITFLLCLFASAVSQASIVLDGTRVIYDSNAKEVTVQLTNKDSSPLLIQSWIDDGNAQKKPEELSVPFTLTPPINRVDAGKGQTLRIFQMPNNLPKDKESLFWLNVLSIPSLSNGLQDINYMQIAFRTRIKLFYRPSQLTKPLGQSVKEDVSVQSDGKTIKIINNGPYFINLSTVSIHNNDNVYKQNADIVAPFSSVNYSLNKALQLSKNATVSLDYIDDYGAVRTFEYKLN